MIIRFVITLYTQNHSVYVQVCGAKYTSLDIIFEKKNLFFLFVLDLQNANEVKDRIILIERGDCTFVDKARKAQKAGAKAVIVIDNVPGSSSKDLPMFAMSGDGRNDVNIPVVFLFKNDADILEAALKNNTNLEVMQLFFTCICFHVTPFSLHFWTKKLNFA